MEEKVKKKLSFRVRVLLGIGGCLGICMLFLGIYIVSHHIQEKEYNTNLESAKEYILAENYEAAKELYLKTIELEPKKVDAYKDLVSLYIDEEAYEDAYTVADEGLTNTGDTFFSMIIKRIQEINQSQKTKEEVNVLQQVYTPDVEQSKVTARFSLIKDISTYCYQQYVNAYGKGNVTKVSDKIVQVKFPAFNGTVFFKNTDKENNVDMPGLQVAQGAKPYQVKITSPAVLFVGYETGIANAVLQQLFGFDEVPVQKEDGTWWLSFEYGGCTIQMQTDSLGNLVGDTIFIWIIPDDQKAVVWEETPEEEITEEDDGETFVLGGQTYTYDVTEIELMDEQIDSLAPLRRCKKLKNLYLINCDIRDISPLQGCTNLEELVLSNNPVLDVSPLANLSNLTYFQFHNAGVSDIRPIYGLNLEVLDTCDSKVPKEQVEEYHRQHPECICYWNWDSVE